MFILVYDLFVVVYYNLSGLYVLFYSVNNNDDFYVVVSLSVLSVLSVLGVFLLVVFGGV